MIKLSLSKKQVAENGPVTRILTASNEELPDSIIENLTATAATINLNELAKSKPAEARKILSEALEAARTTRNNKWN